MVTSDVKIIITLLRGSVRPLPVDIHTCVSFSTSGADVLFGMNGRSLVDHADGVELEVPSHRLVGRRRHGVEWVYGRRRRRRR